MNKYLLKIAEQVKEKKDTHYGKAIVTGGLGAHLTRSSSGRLLGYENRYHGTSKDQAKRIKLEGLHPSKGGTGAARYHSQAKDLQSVSKGKIHTTGNKTVARVFATYNQRKGKNALGAIAKAHVGLTEGKVLKTRLPYGVTRRMKEDPHMTGPLFSGDKAKHIASTTHHAITPKQLKASGSPLGIGRYLKSKRLKKYYKDVANHKRIRSGAGRLTAGLGLLAASAHYMGKSKNEHIPD
jgi:hypothetical protein